MQTIFSKAGEGQEKQDLEVYEQVGPTFSLNHSENNDVCGRW